MRTFLKLIRYQNLLMVLVTLVLIKFTLLEYFTPISLFTNTLFYWFTLSILFTTAAGYIINDIFDVKIDLINKPNKTYIGKHISLKFAWISYAIFTLLGILCAVILMNSAVYSWKHFLFFILFPLALFLYSFYFKKIALLGNITIAFISYYTIIQLSKFSVPSIHQKENLELLVNWEYSRIVIVAYASFSFAITLIREIVKDLEDINGDYALQLKTLPIIIGRKRTQVVLLFLSVLFFCFLVFVLKAVYSYSYFFWYGVLAILVPFAWFIYQLKIAKTTKDYHQLSNLLKLIMCLGILSMLLFKFL